MEEAYQYPQSDTNKTETRLVNHEHGYSTFEEAVFLDLNMKFDEAKQCFEEKKVRLSPGRLRSWL